MTSLAIILAAFFLGTGDFFSKIVRKSFFLQYNCLDVREVWAKSMKAFSKYLSDKIFKARNTVARDLELSIYYALQLLKSFYENIYLLSKNCAKTYVFSFLIKTC